MSLWTPRRCRRSLPCRLTLLYAVVFGLCFLVVFGLFYTRMHEQFYSWTDAELASEVDEINEAYAEKGFEGIVQQLKHEEETEPGLYMARLIDPRGRVTFATTPARWVGVEIDRELVEKARNGLPAIERIELQDGTGVRVIYNQLAEGSVAQVGQGIFQHELWMSRFAGELGEVAVLAFFLSIAAGSFMARRAISPIKEIAQTASAITGRTMGQRVPVSGSGDEVDQLAEAFNGMLERIDRLVNGVRNATDMVAHDLRTPISGVRGMAEVTLRSRRDPEDYQMVLYQITEQMDRLLSLSDTILDVSEAESGALALRLEPILIEELVLNAVQMFGPVASENGITLGSAVAPGLVIEGDRGRLGQVLANLLDNAIKFTPSGGHIQIEAERTAGRDEVIISVADTGPGISEEDLPHIFERYYRADKNNSEKGAGLGLPLVQGIVRAHGGRVAVASRIGKGAVFQLFLPIGSRQLLPEC